MSSDVAIRVEGLTKSFRLYERPEHRLMELVSFGRIQRHRTFTALKDVSLEIRRGETVGIVGRNGCGKSTLLQVICGILQPTAGTVTTQGRIAALLELGAGFDGNFTGRENVYLNGALHGRTRAEMDERIDAIIAFADIGEFIDRPVKTYSSGMFVRLAFATAVNVDPDILVVDEALAVGDEAFQRKCFARIEQIKERGATILFVSHAAQTIIQLCDRAVLMDGGEKLMEGTPKAVITKYQRIINAPTPALNGLIAAIRSNTDAAPQQPDDATTSQSLAFSLDDRARPSFDRSLVPQSTVYYPENGAQIINPRILNTSGNETNILHANDTYIITFEVLFKNDARRVSYATHIRLPNGTSVAGATTLTTPFTLTQVSKGEKFAFSFEFKCNLTPGIFFCNVGVVTTTGDGAKFLHRIQDAIMFRVEHDTVALEIGPARLDFEPSFKSANEPN
ncbi:ABC transporter ATP-binding protein [Phreatobacter sp.]|uniref:ABC transporter ATP-binding protein n=1 Tax=Phreatobacter sp. TaxID=1966341 RepID=UPI0022C4E074|nr:ABC transporter ATP-binding protein [Phreatobacter sp.]MCZ8314944.1 ABC transporter ATP-binding protein [Phreatobacter sp.]